MKHKRSSGSTGHGTGAIDQVDLHARLDRRQRAKLVKKHLRKQRARRQSRFNDKS